MHLSYSKLNTYRQCPLRYRLTYQDRLPRRPRRLFRAARRIHHALMVWLTYAQRGAPSLPEALRAYDHAWEGERQPEVRDLQEYAEGEQILRAYHAANRERPCSPVFLEQKFDVRLGDHRLTGAIDRVDAGESGYEVIDYKLDREIRTQHDVDQDLQLSLYHLALREAHGIQPEALSLYFLRHNLKLTTTRSVEVIRDLGQWVEATGDRITRERRWEPCPGDWCSHCDFRAYCPAVTAEPLLVPEKTAPVSRPQQSSLPLITVDDPPVERQLSLEMSI
jgi:DNA helicase-2/ATP-dependent DNA helicase PcrA